MDCFRFCTGIGTWAFVRVEKTGSGKNLPLKAAWPWQVIYMPWHKILLSREKTLEALPAGRQRSTATDRSGEDSPTIKVNSYFCASWNNPSTGLEACFKLSTNGDTHRRWEAKPAKDGNGKANLVSRHTGSHAARNGQGFHILKRGKCRVKCFRIGGNFTAVSQASGCKIRHFIDALGKILTHGSARWRRLRVW